MSATIEIVRDGATPAVERLQVAITPDRLATMIGAAEVRLFQEHFLHLPRNRMGWPSTNFWAGAAKATHYQPVSDGVVVSVAKQGVRQRWQGGTIRPVNAKYLAIPARAEAYGKRPREFSDLRLLFGKGGQPVALVQAEQTKVSFGKKRKDGSRALQVGNMVGGLVFYWLVKASHQTGDSTVLPSKDEMRAVAVEQIRAATNRASGKNSG